MELVVVIPTAGRNTLERCLDSFDPDLHNGLAVRVLVAIDTYKLDPTNIVTLLDQKYDEGINVEHVTYNAKYHDWGYPQLQYAYNMEEVAALPVMNRYIMNIGDDDIIVPGAFNRIKEIIETDRTAHPWLFQAILHTSPNRGIPQGTSVLLWNDADRSILRQRVTGQNIIAPLGYDRLGQWTDDFEFIRQTIEMWNGRVTWVPEPIVECF